jgi:hypothetical protein
LSTLYDQNSARSGGGAPRVTGAFFAAIGLEKRNFLPTIGLEKRNFLPIIGLEKIKYVPLQREFIRVS